MFLLFRQNGILRSLRGRRAGFTPAEGRKKLVVQCVLGDQGDVSIRPPRPLTTPNPLNEHGTSAVPYNPRVVKPKGIFPR